MRNKKEFEEYVRELGKRKLTYRQSRQRKLRNVSIVLGGCVAACVCVIAAVNISRTVNKGEKNSDGSFVCGEVFGTDELSEGTDICEGDSSADKEAEETSACTMAVIDSDYMTEAGGIYISKAPNRIEVDIGSRSFTVESREGIDRIVRALNELDMSQIKGESNGARFVVLSLDYEDGMITYDFGEDCMSVSKGGIYAVNPEKVSDLILLIDEIAMDN